MGSRPRRGVIPPRSLPVVVPVVVPVLATVLATVLVTALVAGCSGGAPAPSAPPTPSNVPGATPTPTGTPQEQALAWAESVCGALVPVVAQLTAPPALDLGSPEATRQAYLAYLTAGLTTTDQARDALVAAGPAPVAGGDALAEQVRGEVADLRAHLVDARDQVQRADPGSAVSVGRALASGTNLVRALVNGAQVAGTINRDPTLHDAYERSPSCMQLQRAGSTPAPSAPPPVPPTG
jgi:hypothetical protein